MYPQPVPRVNVDFCGGRRFPLQEFKQASPFTPSEKRGSRRTGLTGGCSELLSVRANADSNQIFGCNPQSDKPSIAKILASE